MGAVPLVVSSVSDPELKQHLATLLVTRYVDNPLPAWAVDGALLVMGRAAGLAYPTRLHAAQLVAQGATADEIRGWARLAEPDALDGSRIEAGWKDSRSGDAATGVDVADAADELGALLAQTLACLEAEPVRSQLHRLLWEELSSDWRRGALMLRELWAVLGSRYRAEPLPWSQDPLVSAHLTVVNEALPGRPTDRRVLLVEDNDVMRLMGTEVLRSAGFDVLAAADAACARRLVTEGPTPGLAIIDVLLPDGDGTRLASELGVPRVVLTSGTSPPGLDEILERGGRRWRFLQKPYPVPELLALLTLLTEETE